MFNPNPLPTRESVLFWIDSHFEINECVFSGQDKANQRDFETICSHAIQLQIKVIQTLVIHFHIRHSASISKIASRMLKITISKQFSLFSRRFHGSNIHGLLIVV